MAPKGSQKKPKSDIDKQQARVRKVEFITENNAKSQVSVYHSSLSLSRPRGMTCQQTRSQTFGITCCCAVHNYGLARRSWVCFLRLCFLFCF